MIRDHGRRRGYFLRVGDTDQSYVDLDDPHWLEFDYVRRIADVIDLAGPPGMPLRVVHIGGAALTLPRYVAASRPRSSQTVLEPDVELTALVRRLLPLPSRSGIRIRAVDGLAGIAQLPDGRADVVVLDAFRGARVPAELTTREFLAEVARCLAVSGVLAANLTDQGLAYVRRVAAGLRDTFAHVALCAEPTTLRGRRFGNVILVGSARPLPVAELADRAGRPPFPYRVVHGARLTQVVGAAAPFAGEDQAESPVPPYRFLS